MSSQDRLLIVIPAYNEANSIGPVVARTREALAGADVLVVDDGSSDGTAEQARRAGAKVIGLPFNLGIGSAVQTGYRFAVNKDYRWVARIDGDGQHDAAQLGPLLQRVKLGSADLAVGSRHLASNGYRASWVRYWGTRFFAVVVALITRRHFTDVTSGFIVANRSAVAFLAENSPGDYPEIETLVLLCRAGYRVEEVPVTMLPRLAGRSSIRPLDAIYYVVKVMLAILIGLLRRVPRRL